MSHILGLPPLPECFNGLVKVQNTVSESSQGDVGEGTAHSLVVDEKGSVGQECGDVYDVFKDTDGDENGSIGAENSKLNESLTKLKFEMVTSRSDFLIFRGFFVLKPVRPRACSSLGLFVPRLVRPK